MNSAIKTGSLYGPLSQNLEIMNCCYSFGNPRSLYEMVFERTITRRTRKDKITFFKITSIFIHLVVDNKFLHKNKLKIIFLHLSLINQQKEVYEPSKLTSFINTEIDNAQVCNIAEIK